MKRLIITERMVNSILVKRVFDTTTGISYNFYEGQVSISIPGDSNLLKYKGQEAREFWSQLTNEGKYIRD